MAVTDVPLTTFRFEVVLDLDTPDPRPGQPAVRRGVRRVRRLEVSMTPKTVETGGVNDRQIHLIGPVTNGQLTLKRGMTSNLQLWQWFTRGTKPARCSTAHGEITLWAADGTPAIQYNLTGCLPVRMRAPGLNAQGEGGVAIEELGAGLLQARGRPARQRHRTVNRFRGISGPVGRRLRRRPHRSAQASPPAPLSPRRQGSPGGWAGGHRALTEWDIRHHQAAGGVEMAVDFDRGACR